MLGESLADDLDPDPLGSFIRRKQAAWDRIPVGNFAAGGLLRSAAPNGSPTGQDLELARFGALMRNSSITDYTAGAGEVVNPLNMLEADNPWKNAPFVGEVRPARSYFDPKVDSFLFNSESPSGVLLRRDANADGSTVDTYANGFNATDANGKAAFSSADTRSVLVSGKAFEEVGARLSYLNEKYDPDSTWDQFRNLFTGAMDDPNRLLSGNDRIERIALTDRVNYAANWNSNPEKFSPLLQHLDNVRGSAAGNAAYLGARTAGMDLSTQRQFASLGSATGDVGFARATAVSGGPAYTGAKGRPGLLENMREERSIQETQ